MEGTNKYYPFTIKHKTKPNINETPSINLLYSPASSLPAPNPSTEHNNKTQKISLFLTYEHRTHRFRTLAYPISPRRCSQKADNLAHTMFLHQNPPKLCLVGRRGKKPNTRQYRAVSSSISLKSINSAYSLIYHPPIPLVVSEITAPLHQKPTPFLNQSCRVSNPYRGCKHIPGFRVRHQIRC